MKGRGIFVCPVVRSVKSVGVRVGLLIKVLVTITLLSSKKPCYICKQPELSPYKSVCLFQNCSKITVYITIKLIHCVYIKWLYGCSLHLHNFAVTHKHLSLQALITIDNY